VSFSVDGHPVGTGTTAADGVATCAYLVAVDAALGDTPISAAYAGSPALDPSSDKATLTINDIPIRPGLTIVPDHVKAGEKVTAIYRDEDLNDLTASTRFTIAYGAAGAWGVGADPDNVYTSARAGSWRVTAIYGSQTAAATLTVDPNDTLTPTSVTIAPVEAWMTTAQTLTYTVTAKDPFGNPWLASPEPGDWELDGVEGAFDDACLFTPSAPSVGRVRCTVNGVLSNWADLMVTDVGGPGPFLAWDKDTFRFYLCANPMDPQTGLAITGSGTYDIGGELVGVTVAASSSTNVTVTVSNATIQNSLRVLWYLRSGKLLRSYSYSSLNGAAASTWVYNGGVTTTPLGAKAGFWGPAHLLDAYTAGPPAEWGRVRGYCVPQ